MDEWFDSHRRRLVYLGVVLALALVVPDPERVPAFRAPGGGEWTVTFVGTVFVSGVVLDRDPGELAWILFGTLLFIALIGVL